MRAHSCRAAKLAALVIPVSVFLPATPSFAATSDINGADTAWMIVATGLVLMMTIPALALFYSGMVRKKNVLATMAQSLSAASMISILWVAFGYSLVFGVHGGGGMTGPIEGNPQQMGRGHLGVVRLAGKGVSRLRHFTALARPPAIEYPTRIPSSCSRSGQDYVGNRPCTRFKRK